MDGTAVKQIAEMQSNIERLEADLLTLLSLIKNPEAEEYLSYWNDAAADIATEIAQLQKK